MTDIPIEEQISQYESQLAEVEELLQASPEDVSLLSLKSDLVELLAITRQQIPPPAEAEEATAATAPQPASTPNALEKALEAAVETSIGVSPKAEEEAPLNVTSQTDAKRAAPPPVDNVDVAQEATATTTTTATMASNEPPRKKSKKLKEFEIPSHLVIHDTDTEAQKNKKRREIKSLKNKWRVKKKEIESERKQQSWQSFQKKKGKKNDKSIFSTSDGKVGVVRGEL